MMFVECYCGGLCRRMVGLFWMQISTMAEAVMARWCWKSIQHCKAFWISIVNVVKLDRTNIFSESGTSMIFSMLGPRIWFCSSAVSMSLFICGQMMSTFSRFGRACCTHWCASRSSFYSLLVSSTICSSIVCLSAASVVFLPSKAWMPCRVYFVCWYTYPEWVGQYRKTSSVTTNSSMWYCSTL